MLIVLLFAFCIYWTSTFQSNKYELIDNISLAILEPEGRTPLVYGNKISFAVEVAMPDPSYLPTDTFICVSIGNNAAIHVKKSSNSIIPNEHCVQQNKFVLSGLRTGTILTQIYIKVYPSVQRDYYYIAARASILLDIIDHEFMTNYVSNRLPDHDVLYRAYTADALKRHQNILIKSKSKNQLTDAIPFNILSLMNSYNGNESNEFAIAVLVKNISTVTSSYRAMDWLCQHQYFKKKGFQLFVVTGTNNPLYSVENLKAAVCGVDLKQFDILNIDLAEQYLHLEYINSSTLESDWHQQREELRSRFKDLNRFFCRFIDAILVENTYGDYQTYLSMLAARAECSSDSDIPINLQHELMAPREANPIVVMDLPNMVIPEYWHSLIDAVIAPSKATGLHFATAALGKPTAIIYPPLRESTIRHSVCLEEASDLRTWPRYLNRSATFADKESRNPIEKLFNYVYVGRLASDKCPGLLLRAISYILNYPGQRLSHGTDGAGSVVNDISQTPLFDDQFINTVGAGTITIESSDLSAPSFLFTSEEERQQFRRHARFTIFGEGGLEIALRAMVTQYNISDVVNFAGHLSSEELMRELSGSNNTNSSILFHQGADAMINPIVVGETFGFIHVEAAMLGIPVIAFSAAANEESIQRGILIDYNFGTAVQDLAHAIMLLYKERESGMFSTKDLCEAAASLQRNWNVTSHSDALMNAIKHLIDS